MPHNRTRIWVGLVITAITIPAVGRYYYSSATHDLQGNPIAGQADLESRQRDSFGSGRISIRQSDRDYQAEVDAAIARRGGQIPKNPATRGTDPLFQTRPLDVPIPSDPPMRTASNRAPVAVASTSDIDPNLENLDNTPPDNGGLSDRAVYNIVADNLSDEDRDTFERSWALMTVQERADMLDQFRANLQSK
jgi:hypothetical protein